MCQATQIFDIGMAFTSGLINAIKKNKSFEIESWTKDQLNLFVTPIKHHVKPVKLGKFWREGILKIINKC